MKVRRRIRRSTRQYITVALICVIVIGGAAIFTSLILTDQIRQEYEHKLEEANLERTKNQRSVYTALSDIKIGEILSIENVKKMIVYGSQPEETYAGEEEIGKAVLLDIPAGTQIQKNMLTQNMIDSEMREVEYNVILINSNLINNDYIDIRIMFPNGEDYIVLSKKMMKYMSPEIDSCFLWLSEEEILRMASAIVDAYLYQGTKLYTTKYIEPNIQSSSKITYEPSLSTLLLINDNPNIIETATTELSKQVRKAMENRLAASLSTNVKEIDWKLNTNAIIESDDIPAVLDPDQKVSYRMEQEEREDEVDYGP